MSLAPSAAKSFLRAQLLARRRAQPATARAQASDQLQATLLARPEWVRAQTVALYRPLPSEVDTAALAAAGLAAGKRVAWPVIDAGGALGFMVAAPAATWRKDSQGVEVPSSGERVDVTALDLIVVPGAGFDAEGRRLGLGQGFYDRALMLRRGLAVGLGFGFQVVAQVPTEPHDVRLDAVVTEPGEGRDGRGRLWTGIPS